MWLIRSAICALNQVLGNASELIDGGTTEHLHQCRVGLRRLRSVLRDFAMLEGDPAPAGFARWSEDLASLFRRLGVGRDLDVVSESILPALAAAGGPSLAEVFQGVGSEQAGSVLREAGSNRLWLAAEVDRCIKGLDKRDAWDALLELVVRAGRPANPRP